MKTQTRNETGFTLLELLVVIAIIAMLIGMLSVGLRQTKIISMNLRQASVFHAMTIGLEFFSKDFDGYPESSAIPNPTSANQICGAQVLMEALIGRDEEGVEPITNWYAPNHQYPNPASTDSQLRMDPSYRYYDSTNQKSLDRRKGPYGDFKHIEVYTIYDLWQGNYGTSRIYDSQSASNKSQRAPVFTDTFRRIKILLPTPPNDSVSVGMPILYFKADRAAALRFRLNEAQQIPAAITDSLMNKWTYNFLDNNAIIELPSLYDPALNANHYVDPDDAAKSKPQVFYEQITQRSDTSDPTRPFFKPYNADTFLLISAGWDGIYGTKDDVTNLE